VNGKLPVDQAATSILIQQKVNSPPATTLRTSTDALREQSSVEFSRLRFIFENH
jgi:hypothetical protein